MPAAPRTAAGGQHELAAAVSRLNEVVQEMRDMLGEIRQEIAEDRRSLEAKYLPRVEFTLTQATDAVQLRGLEQEQHSQAKRLEAVAGQITQIEDRRRADRALLLSGLAFPFILLLLSAVLLSGRV